MYLVRWTDRAREDLILKATRRVCRELVRVAETALTIHPDPADPDGGYGAPPELWRRGLTRQRRAELTLAGPTSASAPDDGSQPWDYVLVYRPERKGFLILAVLTNREIAALHLHGTHSTPPSRRPARPVVLVSPASATRPAVTRLAVRDDATSGKSAKD